MKVKEYRKITQEIFRLIEEGVHVINADETTVIYNEAMAHQEKMNRKDVLNKPFREVFKTFDEEHSTMLSALYKGKITTNKPQRYRNKYGKEISTVNSSYPIIENGKIIGAVEITKNITDIEKMSEKIMKLQAEPEDPEKAKEKKIRKYNFENIIGQNANFVEIVNAARKAAQSDHAVFLSGETGTGKELIAQSIHFDSARKSMPFLAQNCAALPENLLEGILFGTVKGGFTGALDRAGLFEQANGGTLLLDELSAMPYALQGKLLRVLQEEYIRRVGGSKDIPIDVRIIATINEPAEELIEKGKLRKDLYYRLHILPIDLPPLRERRDDILLLAEKFLDKHNRKSGKELWMISDEAKKRLYEYDYPGNIRELENIIMSAVSMSDSEHILTEEHLSIPRPQRPVYGDYARALELGIDRYLEEMETRLILTALEENHGNISRAAAQLGIKRQGLQYKMKQMSCEIPAEKTEQTVTKK